MKHKHKKHLSSKSYQCDIRQDATASDDGEIPRGLTLTLMGSSASIKAAKSLIANRLAEENLEAQTKLHHCYNATTQSQDSALTLEFNHLPAHKEPTDILKLVHEATGCDIGTEINPRTRNIDLYKKSGEINTYFTSGADILIRSGSAECRDIVSEYINEKLYHYATHQYHSTNPGEIGTPNQLSFTDVLPNCDSSKLISVYFPNTKTTDGKKAKMVSQTLAEHLSGTLGIPEHMNTPSHSISQ